MASVSRRVQHEVSSVFATTGSIDFGMADSLDIQHRMGSFAIGIGAVDAVYIANSTQTYGIMPGQISKPTILDFSFALTDALFGGINDPQGLIGTAGAMLNFEVSSSPTTIEVASETNRLFVRIDKKGRISQIETA